MSLKFTLWLIPLAEGFAYFDDSLAVGGSLDHELREYTRTVVASSDVYRIHEFGGSYSSITRFFNRRDPNRGRTLIP